MPAQGHLLQQGSDHPHRRQKRRRMSPGLAATVLYPSQPPKPPQDSAPQKPWDSWLSVQGSASPAAPWARPKRCSQCQMHFDQLPQCLRIFIARCTCKLWIDAKYSMAAAECFHEQRRLTSKLSSFMLQRGLKSLTVRHLHHEDPEPVFEHGCYLSDTAF